MPKLTVEGLTKKREGFAAAEADGRAIRAKVNVHMGTCGIAAGARPILTAFDKELAESGARDVLLTNSGCAGLCSQEPMATVELAGRSPVLYVNLTEPKVHEIFERHVLAGTVVKDYVLADIPFFKKQVLIALRNRGLIDPEKIDEAIARGGYKAMAKALTEMPAEKIIDEIMRAGLRGRGGPVSRRA